MSNETENMKTDTPANDQSAGQRTRRAPDAGTGDAGRHRPHRRAGGGTRRDEGPLDALRGRDRQRPRPRQARGGRDPAIRGAEIRRRRGRGGREPAPRPRQPAAGPPTASPRSSPGCARASRASSAASSACWSATASSARTRPARRSTPTCTRRWPSRRVAAHPPGTVMQAWTQAWTLNGRLLRPGMVVVAKAPPRRELAAPVAAGRRPDG